MRRGQKTTTKTTLRSKGRSVLKKDLTGPTLLEMSGFGGVNQALALKPGRWLSCGMGEGSKCLNDTQKAPDA